MWKNESKSYIYSTPKSCRRKVSRSRREVSLPLELPIEAWFSICTCLSLCDPTERGGSSQQLPPRGWCSRYMPLGGATAAWWTVVGFPIFSLGCSSRCCCVVVPGRWLYILYCGSCWIHFREYISCWSVKIFLEFRDLGRSQIHGDMFWGPLEDALRKDVLLGLRAILEN